MLGLPRQQQQQLQESHAVPVPSVPPRRAGVTDGRWDAADEAAVAEAQRDAVRIERQRLKAGGGEVVLGRTLEELQALVTEMGQVSIWA